MEKSVTLLTNWSLLSVW